MKYLILIIAVFSLLTLATAHHDILFWDENAYLGNAKAMIGESAYTEDMRPPLIPSMIAALWLVTGESVFAARLLIFLSAIGLIIASYLLARSYLATKDALLATLLVALSSLLIQWGFAAYTDIPSALFTIMALLLLKHHSQKRLFFAGIFASLAFLSRFPAGLIFPAIGLSFLLQRKWIEGTIFGIGASVPISIWMIRNTLTYGSAFQDFYRYYVTVEAFAPQQPLLQQLGHALQPIGLLILLVPLGIYYLRERGSLALKIYTLLYVTYYLFFVYAKLARYYLGIVPFFAFFAVYGLVQIEKRYALSKHAQAAIRGCIVISAAITLLVFWPMEPLNGCTEGVARSIEFVREKQPSAVMSNMWVWLGYEGGAESIPLEKSRIAHLSAYDPDYILYHEGLGTLSDAELLNRPDLMEVERIEDWCGDVIIYSVQAS